MRGHPQLDDLGPALPRDRWTLVDAVRTQASVYGHRDFLSFEDGSSLSFSDFDRLTDCLATALSDLGLGAGERLLALLTNSREFMLMMIATHKLRAVFVPINTELRGSFLQHQVHNSSPRVIVAEDGLIERFADVDTSKVDIDTVIRVAEGTSTGNPLPDSLAGIRHLRIDELLDTTPRPEVLAEPEPSDVCTIMYTSGTTGPSKGVLMPQGHCYLFGLGTVAAMELTEDDRYFCCMPLFHAMGLLLQVLSALIAGSRVYCVERFSPNRWLEDVRKSGSTVTNALGVMPEFIFRTPESEFDRDHKLHSLVVRWGPDNALTASLLMHMLMIALLVLFGLFAAFKMSYWIGMTIISVCLLFEHWLARKRSLNWVQRAFFTLNGIISISDFKGTSIHVLNKIF